MADSSQISTTIGGSTRIGNVEAELNSIWAQVAEAEGQNAILRATTLNLILYTNETQATSGIIAQVSEAHPCRTLVLSIGDENPDALTAVPTVFCHPSLGSGEARTQVCCEEISITVGRSAVNRIPGAVQALLLPDLPVCLYHEGSISLNDPIFKGLSEVTDGLIVDSATFEDIPAVLRNLAALRDMPHFHANLFDVNWQRLLPWRRAIAQSFDGTRERALLKSIREVEVVHRTARAQGLLLLGWLTSRLGWQLKAGGDANSWIARAVQGDVALHLHSTESGAPGLQKVTILSNDHPMTVALSEDESCLLTSDGRTAALRLMPATTGALISSILDSASRDRVFEEALSMAVTLSSEMHALSQRAGIIVANNTSALARLAARHFVQAARRAIERRGRFAVALSGGSTPRAMHELLARKPYRDQVAWARVHVFWGDERNVPIDHEDSNQRMARDTLLKHVPIPPDNIHGILTGQLPAAEAAERYADELRAFFKLEGEQLPEFDLIFLGLGDDGHTASLFPHTEALHVEGKRLFVANPVPQLNTTRLTLTADAINNAADIVFLVSGRGKADIAYTVFRGPLQPNDYPAQRIQPIDGVLTVIADKDAAAKLRGSGGND